MSRFGYRRVSLALIVLLALCLAVVAGCQGKPPREIGPRPGALAPDIAVTLLDGAAFRLADQRGRPLIVNFWASWCGPCRREMPLLQALHGEGTGGITVLAVNYGESQEVVDKYMQDTQLDLPVALDHDLALARDYLIFGMPTTFFIDGEGVVQRVHTGELTEDLLKAFVATIRG